MSLLTSLIFGLGLLSWICIAGIIYPFKPFNNRKMAVRGLIATFMAMMFCGALLTNNPEFKAKQEQDAAESIQAANIALGAQNYDKAETALADVSDFLSEDKQAEIAQIKGAVAKGRTLLVIKGITANDNISASAKLEKVKSIWDDMQNNRVGLKSISPELELIVLDLVKSIPGAKLKQNRLGYELLVDIDSNTNELQPNYAIKARAYASKISAIDKVSKAKAAAKRKAFKAKALAERKVARAEAAANFKTAVAGATQGLTKKYDKISQVTWYTHPNSPKYISSRSAIYVSLRVKDEGVGLKLTTTYTSESWLFVDNVKAFVDGKTFLLTSGRFKRDSSLSIWEWKNETPSKRQISILQKMASGNDVVLRYNGTQYHSDKTMSDVDKQALARMLAAYGDLRGL